MTSIVTVHLTVTEAEALAELSTLQGLTHESVLIQALRFYQMHVVRTRSGLTSAWLNSTGARVPDDLLMGCPDLGD